MMTPTHTATVVTAGTVRRSAWELRECADCRQQPYSAWVKVRGHWYVLGFAATLSGAQRKVAR